MSHELLTEQANKEAGDNAYRLGQAFRFFRDHAAKAGISHTDQWCLDYDPSMIWSWRVIDQDVKVVGSLDTSDVVQAWNGAHTTMGMVDLLESVGRAWRAMTDGSPREFVAHGRL